MKKPFILALACIVILALGSVPSQSILAMPDTTIQGQGTAESSSLAIASFNIKWIGQSEKRDDLALALILRNFDIVVVQELIAPPYAGEFPNGDDFNPDPQATEFFDAMKAMGFDFKLSREDTGTLTENHNNGSGTEWWVVFYKANKVKLADDLPTDFLADDVTANPLYDRVPHSFAFRSEKNTLDFVLISVHLRPGSGQENEDRRRDELNAIAEWVEEKKKGNSEKDFIILGDMNIEDCDELRSLTTFIPPPAPPAPPRPPLTYFKSLNDECEATNTNVNGPKPYDHVMYRSGRGYTTGDEIDTDFDFRVFNLIEAMRPFWQSADPYPGGALNPIDLPKYNDGEFIDFYSDHHPVVFKLKIPEKDDDGPK